MKSHELFFKAEIKSDPGYERTNKRRALRWSKDLTNVARGSWLQQEFNDSAHVAVLACD